MDCNRRAKGACFLARSFNLCPKYLADGHLGVLNGVSNIPYRQFSDPGV